MNSFQKKARAFFREGEYELCIKETLRLSAQGIVPDPDTAPYGHMLFLHDVYGIARDEMEIKDGTVTLSLKVAKRIAQQRLKDPELDPGLQDQIIDLISILGRYEK